MMPDKIRVLQVRPSQSADLAFDIAGIIESQGDPVTLLGKQVKALDLSALIAALGTTNANGELTHDAAMIQQKLVGRYLFALRNDLVVTGVQQAIVQRQMAYLDKYKHVDEIVAAFESAYNSTSGKVARLKKVQSATDQRTAMVAQAIKADPDFQLNGQDGTNFVFKGSESYTNVSPVAMRSTRHTINIHDGADLSAGIGQTHEITDNWTIPAKYTAGGTPSGVPPPGSDTGPWQDLGSNDDFSFKSQKTSTKYSDFRHPYLDNQIRADQAHMDMIDDLLLQSITASKVADLRDILMKEAQALDLEIQKVQLHLIHSFLTPPFSGTITTVYKNIGEAVRPGEPVLRLENDEQIFLVGIVQHRDVIRIGQTVTVRSSTAYDSGSATSVTGKVLSIRGHDPDDDEWDIILLCTNPVVNGRRALPVNYCFDRETTMITFS